MIKSEIVGVLILLSAAFSSDADSNRVYLRYPGSKAIEFKMSGLFSFSSYNGTNITFKSFKDKQNAYRVGIKLSGSGGWLSGDESNIYTHILSDSTYKDTSKNDVKNDDQSNLIAEIGVTRLWYSEAKDGISLFYGLGPIIGSSVTKSFVREEGIQPGQDNIEKVYSSNYLVYGGLSTTVGVEWFFYKNMSFHIEYYNVFKAGKEKTVYDRKYWNTEGVNDFIDTEKLDGHYVEISHSAWSGISIYFK